jgi:GT2 family glycosyltransferase
MKLVAIVVTHDRIDKLKRTITRLLDEDCAAIVVVDNASGDGTGAWLRGIDDARLDILSSDINLGGAGGFEAGMRRAVARHDPDWLVVMDDDARPEPGTFAAFRAGDHGGADAVAAAAYLPSGAICEMNRPSRDPFRNRRAFWATLLGGGRMGFHLADAAYAQGPCPVDVASFVGLFLSRQAVETGGYPDGDLFLYADDAIYTLGLSKRGLAIRFEPALRFEHDCSTFESGARRVYAPLWKVYYNYRNGLILYRRTAGLWFWLILPLVVAKWARSGCHYGADRARFFRLFRRAVWDGILDRRRHPAGLFDGIAGPRLPPCASGSRRRTGGIAPRSGQVRAGRVRRGYISSARFNPSRYCRARRRARHVRLFGRPRSDHGPEARR